MPGEGLGGQHQREGKRVHVGRLGDHDDGLPGHDPDTEDDRKDDPHRRPATTQGEVADRCG